MSRKNSTKQKGIDNVIAALHLLSNPSDGDGDFSQGDLEGDNDGFSQEKTASCA